MSSKLNTQPRPKPESTGNRSSSPGHRDLQQHHPHHQHHQQQQEQQEQQHHHHHHHQHQPPALLPSNLDPTSLLHPLDVPLFPHHINNPFDHGMAFITQPVTPTMPPIGNQIHSQSVPLNPHLSGMIPVTGIGGIPVGAGGIMTTPGIGGGIVSMSPVGGMAGLGAPSTNNNNQMDGSMIRLHQDFLTLKQDYDRLCMNQTSLVQLLISKEQKILSLEHDPPHPSLKPSTPHNPAHSHVHIPGGGGHDDIDGRPRTPRQDPNTPAQSQNHFQQQPGYSPFIPPTPHSNTNSAATTTGPNPNSTGNANSTNITNNNNGNNAATSLNNTPTTAQNNNSHNNSIGSSGNAGNTNSNNNGPNDRAQIVPHAKPFYPATHPLTPQIEDLERSIQGLRQQAQQHSHEFKMTRLNMNELRAGVEGLDTKFDQCQTQISSLPPPPSLDPIIGRIDALATDSSTFTQKADAMKGEQTKMSNQITSVQQLITNLQSQYSSQQNLLNTHSAFIRNNSQFESIIAQTQIQQDILTKQLTDFTTIVSDHTRLIAALTEDNIALKAKIASLEETHTKTNAKLHSITTLTEDNTALKTKVGLLEENQIKANAKSKTQYTTLHERIEQATQTAKRDRERNAAEVKSFGDFMTTTVSDFKTVAANTQALDRSLNQITSVVSHDQTVLIQLIKKDHAKNKANMKEQLGSLSPQELRRMFTSGEIIITQQQFRNYLDYMWFICDPEQTATNSNTISSNNTTTANPTHNNTNNNGHQNGQANPNGQYYAFGPQCKILSVLHNSPKFKMTCLSPIYWRASMLANLTPIEYYVFLYHIHCNVLYEDDPDGKLEMLFSRVGLPYIVAHDNKQTISYFYLSYLHTNTKTAYTQHSLNDLIELILLQQPLHPLLQHFHIDHAPSIFTLTQLLEQSADLYPSMVENNPCDDNDDDRDQNGPGSDDGDGNNISWRSPDTGSTNDPSITIEVIDTEEAIGPHSDTNTTNNTNTNQDTNPTTPPSTQAIIIHQPDITTPPPSQTQPTPSPTHASETTTVVGKDDLYVITTPKQPTPITLCDDLGNVPTPTTPTTAPTTTTITPTATVNSTTTESAQKASATTSSPLVCKSPLKKPLPPLAHHLSKTTSTGKVPLDLSQNQVLIQATNVLETQSYVFCSFFNSLIGVFRFITVLSRSYCTRQGLTSNFPTIMDTFISQMTGKPLTNITIFDLYYLSLFWAVLLYQDSFKASNKQHPVCNSIYDCIDELDPNIADVFAFLNDPFYLLLTQSACDWDIHSKQYLEVLNGLSFQHEKMSQQKKRYLLSGMMKLHSNMSFCVPLQIRIGVARSAQYPTLHVTQPQQSQASRIQQQQQSQQSQGSRTQQQQQQQQQQPQQPQQQPQQQQQPSQQTKSDQIALPSTAATTINPASAQILTPSSSTPIPTSSTPFHDMDSVTTTPTPTTLDTPSATSTHVQQSYDISLYSSNTTNKLQLLERYLDSLQDDQGNPTTGHSALELILQEFDMSFASPKQSRSRGHTTTPNNTNNNNNDPSQPALPVSSYPLTTQDLQYISADLDGLMPTSAQEHLPHHLGGTSHMDNNLVDLSALAQLAQMYPPSSSTDRESPFAIGLNRSQTNPDTVALWAHYYQQKAELMGSNLGPTTTAAVTGAPTTPRSAVKMTANHTTMSVADQPPTTPIIEVISSNEE